MIGKIPKNLKKKVKYIFFEKKNPHKSKVYHKVTILSHLKILTLSQKELLITTRPLLITFNTSS